MSLSNGKPGYKVAYSGVVFDRIKALSEVAVRIGLGREFAAALRAIMTHLRKDPDEWGDPLYDLHTIGLTCCYGRHWMLIVDYGIHEPSRTVYIHNVRPYPGSHLADAAKSP